MATQPDRIDETTIQAQLQRLLESPGFRASKRYPSLLRHLVLRTLEGRASELKERLLGIEVFGRPADYDCNSDPIVRISAGEIRRRIAQYYHEPGREAEIRIELPLGSYVPGFHSPVERPVAIQSAPAASKRWKPRFWGVALAVVVAVSLVVWFHPWLSPSVFEEFWAPVFKAAAPVYLCVARSPTGLELQLPADRPPVVAWADISAITRLAAMLSSRQLPCRLVGDRATLTDLRQGPAVLVGAFNNVWTLRSASELRFVFEQEGRRFWVLDRQNPSSREWMIDLSQTDAEGRPLVKRDYAVVSRTMHTKTGQVIVAVGGLAGWGTEIAAEFVTNPSLMASIGRQAANWRGKNLQIVLMTEIIDNRPGPPRIVAIESW